MARLIDADAIVTVKVFDDMTEERYDEKMTIAEALDSWADEGCPEPIDAAPVVRCRDCKYYNVTCCSPGFGWCERSGHNHGTTDNWFCADGRNRYD